MDTYEAIYKDGSLKLVGMPKIEKDVVKVKILKRRNLKENYRVLKMFSDNV